jgi:hypothetical protein
MMKTEKYCPCVLVPPCLSISSVWDTVLRPAPSGRVLWKAQNVQDDDPLKRDLSHYTKLQILTYPDRASGSEFEKHGTPSCLTNLQCLKHEKLICGSGLYVQCFSP